MSCLLRKLSGVPALAVLLWAAAVGAQMMADPTRPPRAVPVERTSEQTRAPVLQSVIITPERRAAIINGERVELGAVYGDARVARITETEVVLRSADRTEVLKLYPNVDKSVKRDEPARDAGSRMRN
jgi:MSHA biogenesis protein MshK